MIDLTGMSKVDGSSLSGVDHLRQSIYDILTTRRGERIMRPEYGSGIHELLDNPCTQEFIVDLYYECLAAIHRWEPRVRVIRIGAQITNPGQVNIDLTTYFENYQVHIPGLTIPLQ